MEFDKIYTAKSEHSKEEFVRAVLLKLASNPNTPTDVVKAEFGEVIEREREVIQCKAHVESDYTASVGYDRVEEYYEKVRKYNSSTQQYYYEDVKKSRTVTDWHPFSGHIGGDAVCVALNEDEEYDLYRLEKTLRSSQRESYERTGVAEVSPEGLETVKNYCRCRVEVGIRYPGDHVQDEHSNATVEVKELICFCLPFYETKFVYKGKTYHASGFACGDLDVDAELPESNIDLSEAAAEETKSYHIAMLCAWGAFGASIVLSILMMALQICYWPCFVTVALLGVAIALHIISAKKFNACLSEWTEGYTLMKRGELETAFSQKGYPQLTATEIKEFEEQKKNYEFNRMCKVAKAPIIIGSIATVILLIVDLFVVYKLSPAFLIVGFLLAFFGGVVVFSIFALIFVIRDAIRKAIHKS